MTEQSSPAESSADLNPNPAHTGTEGSADASDLIRGKLQASSFSNVAQEEMSGKDLLAGVGGVRGMIEAGVPPLAFLVGYLISQGDILISVLFPVGAAIIFLIIRAIQKSEILPAISGLIGLIISAGLAYFTGDIMQHFLLGLLSNIGLLVVFLTSIVIGRPIIGYVSGLLLEKPEWRVSSFQKKLMNYATWCWVGLFITRLSIQVPLYLLDSAAQLAIVRLITGVPLLIVVLWLNWFFIRAAFFRDVSISDSSD